MIQSVLNTARKNEYKYPVVQTCSGKCLYMLSFSISLIVTYLHEHITHALLLLQSFEGLVLSNGGVVIIPFSDKTPSYIQKMANTILSVLSKVWKRNIICTIITQKPPISVYFNNFLK